MDVRPFILKLLVAFSGSFIFSCLQIHKFEIPMSDSSNITATFFNRKIYFYLYKPHKRYWKERATPEAQKEHISKEPCAVKGTGGWPMIRISDNDDVDEPHALQRAMCKHMHNSWSILS